MEGKTYIVIFISIVIIYVIYATIDLIFGDCGIPEMKEVPEMPNMPKLKKNEVVTRKEFDYILEKYKIAFGEDSIEKQINNIAKELADVIEELKNEGLQECSEPLKKAYKIINNKNICIYDRLNELKNVYNNIIVPDGYYVNKFYEKMICDMEGDKNEVLQKKAKW